MINKGTPESGLSLLREYLLKNTELISMVCMEKAYNMAYEIHLENPGAIDEDPMILDLEGGGGEEEEDASTIKPYSPELALLESRIRIISEKMNQGPLIAKYNSGYYNGKIQGIAIGLFLSLLIFSLL